MLIFGNMFWKWVSISENHEKVKITPHPQLHDFGLSSSYDISKSYIHAEAFLSIKMNITSIILFNFV